MHTTVYGNNIAIAAKLASIELIVMGAIGMGAELIQIGIDPGIGQQFAS
jgi:hypothetical protein